MLPWWVNGERMNKKVFDENDSSSLHKRVLTVEKKVQQLVFTILRY